MEKHNKELFVANVSHELRTPLNSINFMLQQLESLDLPDNLKQDFKNALTSERRIEKLVSDVLDYFGLTTKMYVPEKSEYDFSIVIHDCVNSAIVFNEDKHLEVVVNCSPSIPVGLIGNKWDMIKVVENLVSNAIKYTSEGGVYINAYIYQS